MPKLRLDNALVEQGLASSRNKAQAIIMAGEAMVNGQVETRADRNIKPEDTISLKEKSCPYVSRGGLKLQGALDAFNIDVKDKICADIGVATGGFSHCFLLRGAKEVYGVDVGKGQIASEITAFKNFFFHPNTNTGNSANGEIFNVLSVYNTVGVTFNNPTVEVAKVSGKLDWAAGTYANGALNVTIPSKEQMYTDTRKVTVKYPIFDGSTNNIFKDEIYVTGKSPIKEGTIEALKTTLSLGQAKKATFTNADFTAKDVWGTAYNLFGTETLADATTTPATAWKWDAPATAKIQNVDVTANTSLVTIDKTYRTTKDGSEAETTKNYTTMTGFTVTVANDAALQAGDKVKVTVKITDQWGMEFTKDVEITVVK